MKWRRRPRSGDLIDRRGAHPTGGGLGGLPITRMGIPGLLILGLMIFLGGNLFASNPDREWVARALRNGSGHELQLCWRRTCSP